MASYNAFGALAMGDASAGPSTRLIEGDEVDIDVGWQTRVPY